MNYRDFQKIYGDIYEDILNNRNYFNETTNKNEKIVDNFYDENTIDIFESIDKNINDGWDEKVINILNDVLTQTDSLNYEIRNCVKGSYTKCKTNEELGKYLKLLASQMELAANEIKNL